MKGIGKGRGGSGSASTPTSAWTSAAAAAAAAAVPAPRKMCAFRALLDVPSRSRRRMRGKRTSRERMPLTPHEMFVFRAHRLALPRSAPNTSGPVPAFAGVCVACTTPPVVYGAAFTTVEWLRCEIQRSRTRNRLRSRKRCMAQRAEMEPTSARTAGVQARARGTAPPASASHQIQRRTRLRYASNSGPNASCSARSSGSI